MNICIIPARGGSKRIHQKNIKDFNGKPIIAYSIEIAFKSNCFDRVIVSTDDDEIAEVAKKFGAEVPFIRPAFLGNDVIGILPVMKNALDWLDRNNSNPKNICLLSATAPFIHKSDLQGSYEQFIATNADYCFGVTSFPYPIQRAIKVTKENRVDMFYKQYFNVLSQDLEDSYHDAGQFYWGKPQAFREERILFSQDSSPYVLPRYLVQDIDTLEDWIRAELMYQVIQKYEALL
jgi:N-acylneuraminate cytidylyltransferase